jgi:hypothetical protein
MRPPGFSPAMIPSSHSSSRSSVRRSITPAGVAEGDLPGEDVVVGEARHTLGKGAAAVGGAGAGTADHRARKLGLAPEEVRETLAGFVDRALLRRRDVDRDLQRMV